MVYSTDGINWTAITDRILATGNGNNGFPKIAYGGGKWVATNFTKHIAYSQDDGITWSTDGVTVSGMDNKDITVSGIAYGNGRFVVIYNSGEIVSSSDGIKWTYEDDVFNSNFYSAGIAFENGKFVVANSGDLTGNAKIAYSN